MKTIISIDGGGVRGIIPLACLVALEKREGRACREIFDMVAGTSTGAVIAAGIALGISAEDILSLYRQLSKEAFRRIPIWRLIGNLGNHRYSAEFINQTLLALGAERPLNELEIDILITAKNTLTSYTDFFVRDVQGNARRWGTLSLRDAVLASIAAPTYFPPHSAEVLGIMHTWTDGGVGVHGNPCYQTAVEALSFSSGKYVSGETRLLSFGTGRVPNPINAHKANALTWLGWTLGELLQDTAEWQTFVTDLEYDQTGRLDFRRYQLDLADEVMREIGAEIPEGVDVRDIDLDSVWAIDALDEIGRAFAQRIDFDVPDGLILKSENGW